jgi:hypothetical protein
MKNITIPTLLVLGTLFSADLFAWGANSGYWGRKRGGGSSSSSSSSTSSNEAETHHRRGGRDDDRGGRGSDDSYYGGGRGGSSSSSSSNSSDGSSRLDNVTRGSAAWFAYESAEHLLKYLVLNNPQATQNLNEIDVELTGANTTLVKLVAANALLNDQCQMYDSTSRRGTVIKKDVRCNQAPFEVRTDLLRGTQQWFLIEAMEHSLRQEAVANAAVVNQVLGVNAKLLDAARIQVAIDLNTGASFNYTCQMIQSSRADVVCTK